MKTKIIYISGGEMFDMHDIRAALQEVRDAMGLGRDTILFGVPVSEDDALATPLIQPDVVLDAVATDEATKTKKSRARATKIVTNTPEIEPEIATETIPEIVTETAQDEPESTDTVIPILSILGAQSESLTEDAMPQSDAADTQSQPSDDTDITDTEPETDIANTETNESDTLDTLDIDAEPYATTTDTEKTVIQTIDIISATTMTDTGTTQSATIIDMISDEVPTEKRKGSIEELLESMTPLREDHIEDIDTPQSVDDDNGPVVNFDDVTADNDFSDVDTDVTLTRLANEFAETEDKIPVAPKSQTHGKIGKLKNILPFKKARRDDGGLMGDLFGWAGIAANDDDFAMPGFFTGVASNK